jgi:hypothetical protein
MIWTARQRDPRTTSTNATARIDTRPDETSSTCPVDRMNLWVYPLLLGRGKQVFADGTVSPTDPPRTRPHRDRSTGYRRDMDELGVVSSAEVEALATKIDAGAPIDDHDREILEVVFRLAGIGASNVGGEETVEEPEVGGFAMVQNPVPLTGQFSAGLSMEAFTIKKTTDKASPIFFRNCCAGSHYK